MEEAESLGRSGRGNFFRRPLSPPKKGVEGLDHDVRGARTAVGVGGMIAGPARGFYDTVSFLLPTRTDCYEFHA